MIGRKFEMSETFQLLADVRSLIEQSRGRVAAAVNAELSLLYWHVGKRINEEVLGDERAEYGRHVLQNLSVALSKEYGKGWSVHQLKQCVWFARAIPDKDKSYTLCNQLSWSHIRLILPFETQVQRDFYIAMCKTEHWSVRTLRERIDSMLYERTAISKKPEETIANELKLLKDDGKMSPDIVFRDPYLLDFLGLRDTYSEKDLESAIVAEMQKFISEFGSDFAFLARQKRITVGTEDYYIDLLFYHRRLHRLVAIELKLGKFKPEYKGQMELYLRWLEENEMCDGEEPPIGLILCAGKDEETVQLLKLENSNIRVAAYMTELPDRKLLEQKMAQAIELARAQLANREGGAK